MTVKKKHRLALFKNKGKKSGMFKIYDCLNKFQILKVTANLIFLKFIKIVILIHAYTASSKCKTVKIISKRYEMKYL